MTLAARLNKRVTLQARSDTQNAIGEAVATWAEAATVWAVIDDMSGREFIAAQATQNAVLTKITIRYRAGVVPSMRALYGSTIYNIEAVLGQDRHTLLLMCSTVLQ